MVARRVPSGERRCAWGASLATSLPKSAVALMAAIDDAAREFTAMLRLGQLEVAGKTFWSPDVTSAAPAALSDDIPATPSGLAAVRAIGSARVGTVRIDDLGIDGPFVTGNQFALFLDMLITDPTSGEAKPFAEIGIVSVRDGCIVEERLFYA